jgi:group II intron reverse transcriptase/maturase
MSKNNVYNGIINILANPFFLQACYLEIKSKPGNMSKCIPDETLDGINQKWFENIASEIKTGKFNFSATSRLMIPTEGKKELRPLSFGNPRDKIVQKALTVLMEAIWDEKLSDNSYGFRPGRSLHQALFKLSRNGSTYQWVIKGEISECFEKIPHKIILKCIESNTTCDKTLQLIRKSLTAGYIDSDSGEHIKTTLGTPQGSVFSPLLANIVLNELDKKVLDIKNSFEKGKKRARNKEYDALTSRIQSLKKLQPGSPAIKELAFKRRTIPSLTPCEPNLIRLMYIRYGVDFVILITGTIDDAKHIKHLIADILTKKCGLELHDNKTLITATKEGFKFLGAWCVITSPLKAGLSQSDKGNPCCICFYSCLTKNKNKNLSPFARSAQARVGLGQLTSGGSKCSHLNKNTNPKITSDLCCDYCNGYRRPRASRGNRGSKCSKYRIRMRIEIPINDLINKLKINKFIKINANNMPVATARKDLVNFSHHKIVSFFNHRIQGLVTFYSFGVNLTSLRKIIMFLHLSCALTLALKHKLRTQRQAFKKFGRTLDDPETGIKLELPSELKVKHLYRGTNSKKPWYNLKMSWFNKNHRIKLT